MIRPLAMLVFLAAGLGAVTAQEVAPAAPATPTTPAAGDITINPAAPIDATPKQANLLTGMYATKAVIEICAVTLEDGVTNGMAIDQKRLETSLGMDEATAGRAYAQVKADVEKTSPDCADGSPDRIGVDAVTNIYKASAAAAPSSTPITPVPAVPAVPPMDAAPTETTTPTP